MVGTRIINAFNIYCSYVFSKYFGSKKHLGLPLALGIEPTTACNLRCPQCPSGLKSFTRNTGKMHIENFKKLVDNTKKTCRYYTLYFQGEPYLNPNFLEMVAIANKHNIFTATSSNAHFLNQSNAEKTIESGLKRIIISIDGTTQETYGKYRLEGNLKSVIEGTKNLLQARKKFKKKCPYIIWQFIVFKHNEHELQQIKQLAKIIGVDKLWIKTAQIYDYENTEEWIPMNEKYSRYNKAENGYSINNKLLNSCWRMWSSAVITWDGFVVPCCFDKDATHTLGNTFEENFMDVWKGNSYHIFRQQLLEGRKNIEICKNCSEGTKVWA